MSSVYRVGLELYGSASGAIGAVNNTMTATTRLGQGFKTAAGQSGVLNNQVKALGTTFRYALAGSVIFGITGALGKLAQFENQLGTINSLVGELNAQGKFQGIGSQLDDIGSDAIVMSNKFGASVTDVEDYMARFASTFNRGSLTVTQYRKEMDAFTNTVLQLQAALGSEAGDPAALAAGIGGLINVIPGGKKNPGKVASQLGNYVAYLTAVTPNITGTDIANAAGRLASVYNTAGMTPAQLFAIFGQAAKAGGSPSIVVRGVQQLLGQSLLTPKSPAAKAAYQQVLGTSDPTTLRKMGGLNVLEKLLQSVTPPGGFKYSKSQLSAANSATTQAQLQQALPGLDLTKLMSFFGRIQSVQQFVNILSQDGVKGLENFVKGLNTATDANLLAQRANANLQRQGLTRLSNSIGNAMLSLVRPLNTPATALENHVVSPVSNALARHRTATTIAEGLLLGGVATKMISGRIFSKGVMAAEAANVGAGSTSPDGSMANPLWVIVSPYSSQLNPSGVPGAGGGTTPTPGKKSLFSRLGSTIKGAVTGGAAGTAARIGVAGVGLAALGVGDVIAVLSSKGDQGTTQYGRGVKGPFKVRDESPEALAMRVGMTKAQDSAFMAAVQKTGKYPIGSTVTFQGNAKADLTIRLVDKNGNQILVTEKKGVPIGVAQSKDTAPQSQGRPGVKKGQ